MHYSIHRETNPGPLVAFTCPKCKTVAEGASFEHIDHIKLLFVIPIGSTSNTYVRCGNCKAILRSDLNLEELHDWVDSDVSQFVHYHVSFVIKFLAVVSLVLCLFPAVGLIMGLITLAASWRHRGWTWTLGLISTAMGRLILLLLGVLAVLGG